MSAYRRGLGGCGWALLPAALLTATLAGCTRPRVSVSGTTSQGIEFLVQDSSPVSSKHVEALAARHCREQGRVPGHPQEVRIAPAALRVAFVCEPAHRQRAAPPAAANTAANTRALGWAKVRKGTDTWALCISFDAERLAKESTDAPEAVAQSAVSSCSALERAIHASLKDMGVESPGFESDLHAQALRSAAEGVTAAREGEAGEGETRETGTDVASAANSADQDGR